MFPTGIKKPAKPSAKDTKDVLNKLEASLFQPQISIVERHTEMCLHGPSTKHSCSSDCAHNQAWVLKNSIINNMYSTYVGDFLRNWKRKTA